MSFTVKTRLKTTYAKYAAVALMALTYAVIMVVNSSRASLISKLLTILLLVLIVLGVVFILSIFSSRKLIVEGNRIIYRSALTKLQFDVSEITGCRVMQKQTVRGVGESDIMLIEAKGHSIRLIAAEYDGYDQLVQYFNLQHVRMEKSV